MPQKKLRYSQYLNAIGRHHRQISYNEVVNMERAMPTAAARLRLVDIHRLVTPYVSVRFVDQVRAVLPLALMLVGFQALALRSSPDEAEMMALGICAVVLGLMLFMEGVKNGLMPFVENIGFLMPERSHVALLLGFGVGLNQTGASVTRRVYNGEKYGNKEKDGVRGRAQRQPTIRAIKPSPQSG